MHGYFGAGTRYLLRTAEGKGELEAVFRFRYEHFFHNFSNGYPGLDRPCERIFEPHDLGSSHYCAFDADGRLCAVSTSTSAVAPDIPPAWQEWFQLSRLAPLGLERVVVSTRMVIHPDHRHNGLFKLFYRFIMGRYLDAGFDYAVHYCTPGLISRYELLGHRVYGEAFTMPPRLLRVPMLIALNDPEHLHRVGSPIAGLCTAHAPRSVASLQAVLPELTMLPNFRLLSPAERLSYVCVRAGTDRLPEPGVILPVLEGASPLCLKAGLSHAAAPGGGFLCLVLSGSLWEQGADRAAGPGSFVGASLLSDPTTPPPPFTVPAKAEILVFDQNLTHAASRIDPDPDYPSPWPSLYLACLRLFTLRQHPSWSKEANSCGMKS
jgi:hypothetical protein